MEEHHNFSNGLMSWNETEDDELTAWLLSDFWAVCFAIGLIVIIVVGVIGNVLVIFVSIRICIERGPTTTIDVYILHMSIADFLFLIFCVPFQGTVYIFNDWPYGLSMCKVAYYCQYVTMYASIWFLVLMSIDRYIAIGHPLKSVHWRSIESASRSSLGVWLMACLFSSPVLYLYTTAEYNSATACFDYSSTHTEYRKWMILFVFLISFLLPTVVIFCMALLVSAAIHTSVNHPLFYSNTIINQTSGSWTDTVSGRRGCIVGDTNVRRRRRVVWLVFALSAWYLVCWFPHSTLLVWLNFNPNVWEWIEDYSWTLFVLKILGHMFTYIHSSLNPILYSLAYEQFRRRLFHVFSLKKARRRMMPRDSAKMSCSYYYGVPSPPGQSTLDKRRGVRCTSSRL